MKKHFTNKQKKHQTFHLLLNLRKGSARPPPTDSLPAASGVWALLSSRGRIVKSLLRGEQGPPSIDRPTEAFAFRLIGADDGALLMDRSCTVAADWTRTRHVPI